MIKTISDFFSRTKSYALSVLLFSFIRQIVFLPYLEKSSDSYFITFAALIFTIELVSYVFTGAIPDYFTKKSISGQLNLSLFKFLNHLALISLISGFAFYIFGSSYLSSVALSVYVYFCVRNNLYLKIHFNHLNFKWNWLYILIRLIPMLIVFIFINDNSIDEIIDIFCISILICEIIFFSIIKYKTEINCAEEVSHFSYSAIFFFIISYALLALLLRGDLVFLERILLPEQYAEYVKMLIVINFVTTPIVLMTSNSLLSYITHQNVKISKRGQNKLFLYSSLLAGVIGVVVTVLHEFLGSILFTDKSSVSVEVVFIIAMNIVLFNLIKTFSLKYSSENAMAISNALAIIFALFMFTVVEDITDIHIILIYCMRSLSQFIALIFTDEKARLCQA